MEGGAISIKETIKIKGNSILNLNCGMEDENQSKETHYLILYIVNPFRYNDWYDFF